MGLVDVSVALEPDLVVVPAETSEETLGLGGEHGVGNWELGISSWELGTGNRTNLSLLAPGTRPPGPDSPLATPDYVPLLLTTFQYRESDPDALRRHRRVGGTARG